MFDAETRAAIDRIATRYGLEPAALMAVAEVESAGVAWWTVAGERRPAIRFEGHYFHRLLTGAARDRAVREGLASPRVGAVRNPRSWSARYALLERAQEIDRAAAIRSTSWGVGQVMGDHYARLGFSSPQALAARAREGIEGQVDLMARYIDRFGLAQALNQHQWDRFARAYNGPGYRRNRYARKMAAAYSRHSRPAGASGGHDEAVADLQRDLMRLGYAPGRVDGLMGPRTREAVRAFQRARGLVADGIPGDMTREEIEQALAERNVARAETASKAGAGLTAGGGAGAVGIDQAADALQRAGEAVQPLSYLSTALTVLFVALTLAGVGLTIWSMTRRAGGDRAVPA